MPLNFEKVSKPTIYAQLPLNAHSITLMYHVIWDDII